jgi:FKBP-type peptidyl-prolyl cis-trans isomerase FkpA
MKFSKWVVVILVVLIAAACSKEKETPKGYKYTVVRKGDGSIIKPGKFVSIDLVFKDSKDSTWSDSRTGEFPLIIPVRDTAGMKQEEGLEELFRVMSKGDSFIMKIKAQSLFEKTYRQPVPPKVDPNSDFTFYLSVKEVYDSTAVRKLSEELMAKQQEKMRVQQEEQLAKDTVTIDNYLKEKNIVAKTTPSGLRYVLTKSGKGENVKPGQRVKIHYAGYLLNGKYFDSSMEKVVKEQGLNGQPPFEPIELNAARGEVIPGWDEAMQLMNKGSKMTVYIPSTLAYGPNKRSADIIENSILVFDMEMVDIK